MTDTSLVQGEFAPADTSFAADISVQSSPLDAVVAAATEADVAVTAEPNGFIELGLAPELVQAVADLGYTQPTSVQLKAIPLAMGGGNDSTKFIDLMVSSQTGSGKTAAFLLPVLHTLINQQAAAEAEERAAFERAVAEAAARGEPAPKRAKRKDPTSSRNFKAATPGALILCPTRELAQQVAHDAIDLVKHCRGLRVANVVGGMPYQLQIAKLQNADLVVATPGRLLDLQRSMQIKLDKVQFLVVDEADRMLDLGFSDDLAELNQLTAQRKQTMMFSATFAPRIQQLAMRVMHDGGSSVQKVTIDSPQEKHANIKQMLYWADNAQHKRKMLDHWLRDTTINQAIVFASTQVECDGLANDLQQEGFSAVALHGALSQGLRNRRLMALRAGQVQILVATDVAARGIDVPTITHVFNFGLPMKAEDYTHRIGRTGRAGRDGLAITFAEFRDRRKIYDIESYSRQQFKAEVIPGMEPSQRAPQAPRGGDFGGGRGAPGRSYDNRDNQSRGRFGGPARGGNDRGGFGGGFGGGFAGRDNRGAPARGEGAGGFAGRDDRSFAPRRDGEGYGRKPGFGDAGRGNFAPRGDAGAPRGDFAPRKPAFAKPAGGGGKPFVAHDARKRPARPAR
ncbi:superfamily II DNA/RNA helicase [Acidovorax sp. 93]|jgi:superfamily II DNA/RNA helicase|uniref:DEAD/DEAH box helicase n=1 Tax=Acidovorax sp. 93 TaxID=2135632 RepID=UPI000EB5DFC4|nr:DEAD/DEAH box helicase [Acidovorax sp. 93]RKR25092.1 superfamily II DNA/RNA helicase [Acidovorax sp. 93]